MQFLKSLFPPKRPLVDAALEEYLRSLLKNAEEEVAIVGLRGFYNPGSNKRGIYDDAIFIVSPSRLVPFNANTDPAYFKKGIANLTQGLWKYRIGIHGLSKPKWLQYEALVQASKVALNRDGSTYPDVGYFGINIHKGSRNSVSSIGCQTIHPGQWSEFIETVKARMKTRDMQTIAYILKEV